MLENSRHTVRLPTLPRQVIFLAIGLFSAGLIFVMPYIYAEWLNRNMAETHGLAEIMVKMAEAQSDMDWQAMKGQREMQKIRIRASSNEEACLIRVSDTGPGLPGAERGNLLMPHMGGVGRPDSTGLGLKIVTDLVSWHGGRLDIIHSDGHGTQFQITLPHRSPGAPRDDTVDDDAVLGLTDESTTASVAS